VSNTLSNALGSRLHLAACPHWNPAGGPARCTCPRAWRIRKQQSVAGDRFAAAFPWVISRYIESTNSYDYWLRAASQPYAMSMVSALIWASAAVHAGR
jgi:hypothetical protein